MQRGKIPEPKTEITKIEISYEWIVSTDDNMILTQLNSFPKNSIRLGYIIKRDC